MESYVCVFMEGRFIAAKGPFGIHGAKCAIALLESLRDEHSACRLDIEAVAVPRNKPEDIFAHPSVREREARCACEAIQADLRICTMAKKCAEELAQRRAKAAMDFCFGQMKECLHHTWLHELRVKLDDLADEWNDHEIDEAWENGFDFDAWSFANEHHESARSQQDAKALLEMAEKTGGWFKWFEPTDDRDGVVAFVTMAEWLAELALWRGVTVCPHDGAPMVKSSNWTHAATTRPSMLRRPSWWKAPSCGCGRSTAPSRMVGGRGIAER